MATVSYIIASMFIIPTIPTDLKVPLILYLIAIICNFGISAIFHTIHWTGNTAIYFRRLDHVMIFVKIAATYYAGISTVVPDINPLVIDILAIGISLGIIVRLFFTDAPQIIIALPYLLTGWAVVLDPHSIISAFERIPIGATIALLGGVSYTIGFVIYSMKLTCFRSSIISKYIGFHEIFHIFTILGATLFTICLFGYGIPYYNNASKL